MRPQTSGGGESTRHKLAENIFSLYVLQGLNYIIPMAVLPYLVRTLGMERYGLIAFAQSFAQYFTLLTDYGFNFSATRSIAQQRNDESAVSRLFCSVLLIKSALMVVGFAVLAGIVEMVPRFHHNSEFFLVAYLAVAGNVLFPVWYFQGIENMRYISGITGASRLLGAVALFIFVHRPGDALLSLSIQSITVLIAGAAALWISLRGFSVRLSRPTSADLRNVLWEGWHLFVSTAAVSLYTNTNVFVVGILAGDLQAGYFSAAEKLIRAMQGLITPVSQAMFPHMSALAARSRRAALEFAVRMLRWMGTIAFAASLAILLLAAPVVAICFGKSGLGSVPIIRWIAFLPFLVAVSNVLGIQTMVTFGLDRQFSRILIFGGIFNVALAVPLVWLHAAQGAAMSVMGTETFVTVTMGVVLWRNKLQILQPQGTIA